MTGYTELNVLLKFPQAPSLHVLSPSCSCRCPGPNAKASILTLDTPGSPHDLFGFSRYIHERLAALLWVPISRIFNEQYQRAAEDWPLERAFLVLCACVCVCVCVFEGFESSLALGMILGKLHCVSASVSLYVIQTLTHCLSFWF